MFYTTIIQPPIYRQMSLDEFLFGVDYKSIILNPNNTNTRTYQSQYASNDWLNKMGINCNEITEKLNSFVSKHEHLFNVEKSTLFKTFYIPKKSGGLRRIDAPNDELMEALRELKDILENDCKALYHTSAFAYIKGRSTLDAIKRHQQNESKWFGKYDLKDFFNNTTLDFVMKMFSMITPFCFLNSESSKNLLRDALSLAFLDDRLPQGTPISPLITNIMMIPIDFELARTFRDYNNQRYIYTRYADDFIISSRYEFSFREIEGIIKNILSSFDAPFTVNEKKTRYGSSAGSNWNLGVILNKDNQITIGRAKKRQFRSMLNAYAKDKQHGRDWNKNDVQVLDGYFNYYKMVEGDTINRIVEHVSKKTNFAILKSIKEDLRK